MPQRKAKYAMSMQRFGVGRVDLTIVSMNMSVRRLLYLMRGDEMTVIIRRYRKFHR